MSTRLHIRIAAAACALALVTVACGDDDDDSSSAATTAAADVSTPAAATTVADDSAAATTQATVADTTAADTAAPATTADGTTPATTGGGATGGGLSGVLWDNGPCDTSKEVYKIGITAPGENPVLTLVDQMWALEASITAFNARGGIGGHCMEAVTCDSEADPNTETACARDLIDAGVVATVNDTTPFSGAGYNDVLQNAGIARFHDSPSSGAELASTVVYPIGAGGAGTTFLMAPPCAGAGRLKMAAIHVDTPTIGGTLDAMETMIKAHGGELVARIPVAAGTTDFQQFILAAEAAGADCAMLPLGGQEAAQVLAAGQALGTDMLFSTSWGTFPLADIEALGDFGDQILFNAEIPPVTASQDRWPVLEDVIADLAASGHRELEADQLKSSPVRSWVGVYALVRVIEDFGTPDTVTPEAVTAAITAAKDVDMLGLTPAWTPTAFVAPGTPFSAISQPWYYWGTYDNATQSFEVDDNYLNVMAELGGVVDYPQP